MTVSTEPHATVSQPLFDPQETFAASRAQALDYFERLAVLVRDGACFSRLQADMEAWQKQHFSGGKRLLSRLEASAAQSHEGHTRSFLERLYAEKKLDAYLEKSVAYILLRDLGAVPQDPQTQQQHSKAVAKIKRFVLRMLEDRSDLEGFSLPALYEKAGDYGLQDTFIWLMEKLHDVQTHLPEGMDKHQGMRKLVKVIAGVCMHHFAQTSVQQVKTDPEATRRVIELGYAYGITYPLIDDIQDAALGFSEQDKVLFNRLISDTLSCGKVPPRPTFSAAAQPFLDFVYGRLSEAFALIQKHQSPQHLTRFLKVAYVFFHAQDLDRRHSCLEGQIPDQELYPAIVLKSAGSRLLARSILEPESNPAYDQRTFEYGMYNQFHDDIKDIDIDLQEGNVTPYTHFLTYKDKLDPGHLNPYELYWAVVYHLIYNLYQNHEPTKALLLERAINAHKSLKTLVGADRYRDIRSVLKTRCEGLDQVVDQIVVKPTDIAWFDKLISRHIASYFRNKQGAGSQFEARLKEIRRQIENFLPIAAETDRPGLDQTLVEAANFSLESGGKHLRAILAYALGVDAYGFQPNAIAPVLRFIEYMHTASLIFDDKPSQDGADFRRGRPTLHRQYQSEATAELTGIYMMMKAVEEQASIAGFKPEAVLRCLRYSMRTTQAMCQGQYMDLQAKGKKLSPAQLEDLSFYKTGLAIEAAVLIPAILADATAQEQRDLERFARHFGILFQIRDDMLDEEGNAETLGKPTGQDEKEKRATFVTLLGLEGARRKLFEHYFKALSALEKVPHDTRFIQNLLEYATYRES